MTNIEEFGKDGDIESVREMQEACAEVAGPGVGQYARWSWDNAEALIAEFASRHKKEEPNAKV